MNYLIKLLLYSFLLFTALTSINGSQLNIESQELTQDETKSKKIITRLKQRGIKINSTGSKSLTLNELKQVATLYLDTNINNLQTVIDGGAKIDYQDEHGNTPVHIAAYKRDEDTVNFLVRAYRIRPNKYSIDPVYGMIKYQNKSFTRIKNKAGQTVYDIININNRPSSNVLL